MNLLLYDYAGVPKERILIENKSQNTGQNYEFVQKLLEDKGISKGKSILIKRYSGSLIMASMKIIVFNLKGDAMNLTVTFQNVTSFLF